MAPTILPTVTVPTTSFDLLELVDVKLELSITSSTDDAWLAKVISRASSTIRNYCNRVFQVQGYQDQIWPFQDAYPWQLPGNPEVLQLRQSPLAAAPSIAGIAPPGAPSLSSISGGSLAAQKLFARISYVTVEGETAASLESFLAVAANHLLQIAAPAADPAGLAIGWNAYVGAASFSETMQNGASPVSMAAAWSEPSSGLVAGTALPSFTLAVENCVSSPTPLAEGVDFVADPQLGQLRRLLPNGQLCKWSSLPIAVQYSAGFSDIPDDLQQACVGLVKGAWFSRQRDPMLRSRSSPGVYEEAYWFGNGPGGGSAGIPPEIAAILDNYRTPVVA